ncbi:MAG: putative aspartyl protease [Desulforhopalus sp.]|jgi:predicted aspartyl protease
MNQNNSQPSKVTKVLIHKVHGGRKKDSKFWNNGIDISKINDIPSIPIERKKTIRRRINNPAIFLIILILSSVMALVAARPDLFPFLDYHKVYKTIERIDNLPLANGEPQKMPKYVRPKTYPISNPNIPVRYKEPEPVLQKQTSASYASNNIHNDIISNVSLKGLVFSWKDKDGKRHFSNTDYPADNPTLQVQTEINTYRKITKVRINGNRIYVPVTLKNNGRSTTSWMLLDTGCSITNVPYSQLNKIDANYGGTISLRVADGRKTTGRKATIDAIQIGSQKECNFKVAGTKVAGPNNRGLLGLDFLKRRPFKVDYDRQMLVWM